jgi:DNA-binding MarR family transcriptional regulator
MQRANQAVSQKQLQLLYEVYRFRFITAGLLAKQLHYRSVNSVRDRLELLCQAGYIEKVYRPEFRLQGRAAYYYVLPKSRSLLRTLPAVSATGLLGIYKLPRLSEAFRDHCLELLDHTASLQERYPDQLHLYTRPEMVAYDYFIRPLPDLFVVQKHPDGSRHYFLIEWCTTSVPAEVLAQRVLQYHEYISSGAWQVTRLPDPTVLIVCATDAQYRAAAHRLELLSYEAPAITLFRADQTLTPA